MVVDAINRTLQDVMELHMDSSTQAHCDTLLDITCMYMYNAGGLK